MVIHPQRRRQRRFPVSVGGTSGNLSALSLCLWGEAINQRKALPCSKFTTLRFTQFGKTLHQSGVLIREGGQGGGQEELYQRWKKGSNTSEQDKSLQRRENVIFWIPPYSPSLMDPSALHSSSYLRRTARPEEFSKSLKEQDLWEQGNNKPSLAQWKWQHVPLPSPPPTPNHHPTPGH